MVDKQQVQYEIVEDPFPISTKFKRQIPLNRNMFELRQHETKNYEKKKGGKSSEVSLLDPFHMKVAMQKYLLASKMLASFCVVSLVVDLMMVYGSTSTQTYYLASCMSAVIVVAVWVQAWQRSQLNTSRMIPNAQLLLCFAQTLIALPHPLFFLPSIDRIMHLLLLLRIVFPLNYLIASSIYFDSRASRILNTYGIKANQNFFFACKVLLNDMKLSAVLFLYVTVVFFYSHCLFLVDGTLIFIDCFEVVMATLPTIGYGDYILIGYDRIVVLTTLVTGFGLNAFVTLSILKKFEMSTRQANAYILLKKLRMVYEIEVMSKQFIVERIKKKKEVEGISNEEFKKKYLECKSVYRQLKPQQNNFLINSFAQSFEEFKLKSIQSNQMLEVLLRKLQQRKDKVKRHREIFKI